MRARRGTDQSGVGRVERSSLHRGESIQIVVSVKLAVNGAQRVESVKAIAVSIITVLATIEGVGRTRTLIPPEIDGSIETIQADVLIAGIAGLNGVGRVGAGGSLKTSTNVVLEDNRVQTEIHVEFNCPGRPGIALPTESRNRVVDRVVNIHRQHKTAVGISRLNQSAVVGAACHLRVLILDARRRGDNDGSVVGLELAS